jgi:hypothetical protein
MAAVDDLDQILEQFHLAAGELLKGNPDPVKKLPFWWGGRAVHGYPSAPIYLSSGLEVGGRATQHPSRFSSPFI